MPIVWQSPLDVDAYAARGRDVDAPRPACPSCAGPTQRWHGYRRHLRDDRDRLIWIPRVRCTRCGATRALLPSFVLPGGPFIDPEADAALFGAIRAGLRPDIPCQDVDANINDPAFAEEAVDVLLDLRAQARPHTAQRI